MKTIPFDVLTDSDHLTCEPLQELKALIRAGRMPRLVSLWGVLPGGDCELIATAFMTDIAAAAPLGFHWRHVTGDCAHRPASLGRIRRLELRLQPWRPPAGAGHAHRHLRGNARSRI